MTMPTILPVIRTRDRHWAFLCEHATLMHLPETFGQHPDLH